MEAHIWQAGRIRKGKRREVSVVRVQDLVCSSSRRAQRLAMHCHDTSRKHKQDGASALDSDSRMLHAQFDSWVVFTKLKLPVEMLAPVSVHYGQCYPWQHLNCPTYAVRASNPTFDDLIACK
jgi:hypothetical protein